MIQRTDITGRNEKALKSLRRARRAYRVSQTPENRAALKSAVIEWMNAHRDYVAEVYTN